MNKEKMALGNGYVSGILLILKFVFILHLQDLIIYWPTWRLNSIGKFA